MTSIFPSVCNAKLVIGNTFANPSTKDRYDFAVARLNSNGSADVRFGNKGVVKTPIGTYDDYAMGVVIQADGKIVVAGATTVGASYTSGAHNFALVRYLP